MKTLLLVISVFSYFISSRNSNNDCFQYPPKIVELDSKQLYDTARWIIYNWLGPKKIDGVYYGEMDLRYKSLFIRNDSLEIFFNFYTIDSTDKEKKYSKYISRTSVAFRKSTGERLWAFHYPLEYFTTGLDMGDKLLVSPFSDTAMNYIHMRQNSINECYLEMAKRKDLLK